MRYDACEDFPAGEILLHAAIRSEVQINPDQEILCSRVDRFLQNRGNMLDFLPRDPRSRLYLAALALFPPQSANFAGGLNELGRYLQSRLPAGSVACYREAAEAFQGSGDWLNVSVVLCNLSVALNGVLEGDGGDGGDGGDKGDGGDEGDGGNKGDGGGKGDKDNKNMKNTMNGKDGKGDKDIGMNGKNSKDNHTKDRKAGKAGKGDKDTKADKTGNNNTKPGKSDKAGTATTDHKTPTAPPLTPTPAIPHPRQFVYAQLRWMNSLVDGVLAHCNDLSLHRTVPPRGNTN